MQAAGYRYVNLDKCWQKDARGVVTAGNPPDAADDAVQADIVAAGYGT